MTIICLNVIGSMTKGFACWWCLILYLWWRILNICRQQGDIRRRPRLPSLVEEGGAPPHHQPQLLCRNQRPRNRTADVKRFILRTFFEIYVQLEKQLRQGLMSVVFLQDKGEVSLCVWRHLLVLRGLPPLSSLHVPPDVAAFHTGTLPGRAIHACKTYPSSCITWDSASFVIAIPCILSLCPLFRCMKKQRGSWRSYQNPLKKLVSLLKNPDRPLPCVPCKASDLPPKMEKQPTVNKL